MIDIDEIINKRQVLDNELLHALATMEKKDTIFQIREKIANNQERCPHYSAKYDMKIEGCCPFCGKKF